MRPDGVDDGRDTVGRVVDGLQVRRCHPRPLLFVGDACLLFDWPGDIVEDGGRDKDRHIRTLAGAERLAEADDPEGVVKPVSSRPLERRPDVVEHRGCLFIHAG